MNRLDTKRRTQVVAALVEGCSVRSTCRMTGVAKGTVLKLLRDLGSVCANYMNQRFVNLSCKRIQCDEIWSFCYAKDKNVPASMKDKPGVGSVWTWTAIDADTKLIVGYYLGTRDAVCASRFMRMIARRLAHRVQLTTDGLHAYLWGVGMGFEGEVDYAQLIKMYGPGETGENGKYSPPVCTGTRIKTISGDPDPEHVSTSYVERQNLTMRMSMRRFTRLTNAFSKKVKNLEYSLGIHFMHYNYVRIHQTLRVTPAMALLDQVELLAASNSN